ncbi:glycosyltransferase [Candidatus Parcubacteria bacterium]|nr:glycosyltransferase [Candidatus Parcubacteria bacterium]
MNHKVAIIIVNLNGFNFLKNCLNAVFNQTYKIFDVYFVDNGSHDKSVDFVRQSFSKTKIIELDYNTGFAKGNNIGIKEALKDENVEYIALLNNDTIVEKDWLLEMVKVIKKYKNIKCGMVSTKTLLSDGKIHNIGLKLYKNLIGNKIGGCSFGFGYDPNKYNKEREVFCPGGVSTLFSRNLLKDVGLFDEDFFAYAEDLDLGFRSRLAGWKCFYAPKSRLIHLHSQTSGVASAFKAFYSKRNSYFVAIKNFSLLDLLSYPFRDFYWNFTSLFQKNKLKSVNKLKSKIGLLGMVKIMIKIYLNILYYLPRMLTKRCGIKKNERISRVKYKKLFLEFNKKNVKNKLCKICNNINHNNIYWVKEQILGMKKYFPYLYCSYCGCLQLLEIPKNIFEYYAKDYYSKFDFTTENILIKKIKLLTIKSAVNKKIIYNIISFLTSISKLDFFKYIDINKEHKILDIGCGKGSILYYLTEIGFKNCIGIDPFLNKDKIIYPNGLKIYKKNLTELVNSDEKFDIIMLHHSFEHMDNPAQVLLKIYKLMTNKSLCIIRTPVADSCAWEKFKEFWFQIDAPRHLFVHTQKSMALLAEKANLNIVKIIHDSVGPSLFYSQLNKKGINFYHLKKKKNHALGIFNLFYILYNNFLAKKYNKRKLGDQAIFIIKK